MKTSPFITLAFSLLAVTAFSAEPSAAPTPAEIEAGIRKTWVKPAAAGSDGEQTVEIKSIKVGTPRKWNLLDGGNGTTDTDLYPAKVHWLLRTHYRTRTAVIERESIFSVFKNSFDEWSVGLSSGTGQTQKRYEEPSTMK